MHTLHHEKTAVSKLSHGVNQDIKQEVTASLSEFESALKPIYHFQAVSPVRPFFSTSTSQSPHPRTSEPVATNDHTRSASSDCQYATLSTRLQSQNIMTSHFTKSRARQKHTSHSLRPHAPLSSHPLPEPLHQPLGI